MTDTTWTRQDELFAALDHRCVTIDGRFWQVYVYGIRLLDDALWIELDLIGTPTFVLTMRQSPVVDSERILDTLTRYVSRSDSTDRLVLGRILDDSDPATSTGVNPNRC